MGTEDLYGVCFEELFGIVSKLIFISNPVGLRIAMEGHLWPCLRILTERFDSRKDPRMWTAPWHEPGAE